MSESSHILRIPTLWVFRTIDGNTIPWSRSIMQDVEIMAVKMHGVRTGIVIVDDDPDARVCAEVHDIPFWVVGVGVVLLLGEEKHWVVVVALEGVAVHVEELLAGGVDKLVDGYVIRDAWLGEGDGVVGDGLVERVL
jgi:hypothetical protein